MNLSLLKEDFNVSEKGFLLKNYLNIDSKTSLKLLDFRNSETVRLQMITSKVISQEDHLQFLRNLKNMIAGYWALFDNNNNIIGSISLTQLSGFGDNLVAGNFLNPTFIGSGLGALINYFTNKIAFEYVKCDKFYSVVKTSNTSALRLNKYFGGQQVSDNLIQSENDFSYFLFTQENWINEVKPKSLSLIFR